MHIMHYTMHGPLALADAYTPMTAVGITMKSPMGRLESQEHRVIGSSGRYQVLSLNKENLGALRSQTEY